MDSLKGHKGGLWRTSNKIPRSTKPPCAPNPIHKTSSFSEASQKSPRQDDKNVNLVRQVCFRFYELFSLATIERKFLPQDIYSLTISDNLIARILLEENNNIENTCQWLAHLLTWRKQSSMQLLSFAEFDEEILELHAVEFIHGEHQDLIICNMLKLVAIMDRIGVLRTNRFVVCHFEKFFQRGAARNVTLVAYFANMHSKCWTKLNCRHLLNDLICGCAYFRFPGFCQAILFVDWPEDDADINQKTSWTTLTRDWPVGVAKRIFFVRRSEISRALSSESVDGNKNVSVEELCIQSALFLLCQPTEITGGDCECLDIKLHFQSTDQHPTVERTKAHFSSDTCSSNPSPSTSEEGVEYTRIEIELLNSGKAGARGAASSDQASKITNPTSTYAGAGDVSLESFGFPTVSKESDKSAVTNTEIWQEKNDLRTDSELPTSDEELPESFLSNELIRSTHLGRRRNSICNVRQCSPISTNFSDLGPDHQQISLNDDMLQTSCHETVSLDGLTNDNTFSTDFISDEQNLEDVAQSSTKFSARNLRRWSCLSLSTSSLEHKNKDEGQARNEQNVRVKSAPSQFFASWVEGSTVHKVQNNLETLTNDRPNDKFDNPARLCETIELVNVDQANRDSMNHRPRQPPENSERIESVHPRETPVPEKRLVTPDETDQPAEPDAEFFTPVPDSSAFPATSIVFYLEDNIEEILDKFSLQFSNEFSSITNGRKNNLKETEMLPCLEGLSLGIDRDYRCLDKGVLSELKRIVYENSKTSNESSSQSNLQIDELGDLLSKSDTTQRLEEKHDTQIPVAEKYGEVTVEHATVSLSDDSFEKDNSSLSSASYNEDNHLGDNECWSNKLPAEAQEINFHDNDCKGHEDDAPSPCPGRISEQSQEKATKPTVSLVIDKETVTTTTSTLLDDHVFEKHIWKYRYENVPLQTCESCTQNVHDHRDEKDEAKGGDIDSKIGASLQKDEQVHTEFSTPEDTGNSGRNETELKPEDFAGVEKFGDDVRLSDEGTPEAAFPFRSKKFMFFNKLNVVSRRFWINAVRVSSVRTILPVRNVARHLRRKASSSAQLAGECVFEQLAELRFVLSLAFLFMRNHKWPIMLLGYWVMKSCYEVAEKGLHQNAFNKTNFSETPEIKLSPRDVFAYWAMGGAMRDELREKQKLQEIDFDFAGLPPKHVLEDDTKQQSPNTAENESPLCVESNIFSDPRRTLAGWTMGNMFREDSPKPCGILQRKLAAVLDGDIREPMTCWLVAGKCIFRNLFEHLSPYDQSI